MISLEDCIGLCGLDRDQVAAIVEHEHIPEIAATALADYLIHQPRGAEAIRAMIVDDIRKDAPIGRVCSEEVPIPYARHLEEAAIPQVPKIAAAAKAALARA